MGAFAHIVAFNEDFKNVEHVHPMGNEPTKATERSGPELQFHFKPHKAGFVNIFAPFAINVVNNKP